MSTRHIQTEKNKAIQQITAKNKIFTKPGRFWLWLSRNLLTFMKLLEAVALGPKTDPPELFLYFCNYRKLLISCHTMAEESINFKIFIK